MQLDAQLEFEQWVDNLGAGNRRYPQQRHASCHALAAHRSAICR